MKTFAIPLLLALALTACGGGKMEGSYYQESSEEPTLVLKPNGKAVFMGMMEYPYEVEGKDVKLLTPEGTVILEGKEDGSLLSMFGKLKKRPS